MNYNFRFEPILDRLPELLAGAWMTIQLSATAMAIGLALAVPCAIIRTSGPRLPALIVSGYVETVRNTPFLVQIFIVFFGLPSLGVRFSPDVAALIAMALNVGAYVTEILRSGIEAVPRGQVEAGKALGLGKAQIFVYVVLRPAIRAVYPALTSQYVLLILQSSVISAISAEELTSVANDIASQTFSNFEVYLIVTAIYFIMGIGFAWVFHVASRVMFAYPEK
ncbi:MULTISPECIES: amino acid ABC transporter permease [unclassified Chelatococcus]|uniref:amino acid ABC transporter permease n=1 Tax=unclassified Chelatococcus TaxID=2638111 RepID=UPI001BCE07E2|nr:MULTISPECIES: amino acid ABC transporter permease [unclassified Chelatococcus]MBS7700109.1 amino acid ABC transporter permease [Chelatococcus sp. YT9]MBX3556802.1 amino acid ABC transporter permease [Chelatococcus sp.]